MTERNDNSQLELFSPAKKEADTRSGISSSLLAYIKTYEKALLFLIAFIITGIAAFSLGVERGKQLTASGVNPRFDTAAVTSAVAADSKIKTQETKRPAAVALPDAQLPAVNQEELPAKKNKDGFQAYTIQLASYQAKSHAQVEANALKKRGLPAILVPKGKYLILCVGNFANKEMAQSLLTKLKKQYQDCFIRRL